MAGRGIAGIGIVGLGLALAARGAERYAVSSRFASSRPPLIVGRGSLEILLIPSNVVVDRYYLFRGALVRATFCQNK